MSYSIRSCWKSLLILVMGLLIHTPSLSAAPFITSRPPAANRVYTIRAAWETAPFAEDDQEVWFTIAPLPPEPWDELSLTTRVDGRVYERDVSPDGFSVAGLGPGHHSIEVSLSSPQSHEVRLAYDLFVIGPLAASILTPDDQETVRISETGVQATATISMETPGGLPSIPEGVIRRIQWSLDDEQVPGSQTFTMNIPCYDIGPHTLRFEAETLFGGVVSHEIEFIAVPDISLVVTADGIVESLESISMRTCDQMIFHADIKQLNSRVVTGKLKNSRIPQGPISQNIFWYVDGKLFERGAELVFEAEPGTYQIWAVYDQDTFQIPTPPIDIIVRDPLPPRITAPAESGYPYVGGVRELVVAGEGEPDAIYTWTLETPEGKVLTVDGQEASFGLDQIGDIEGSILTLSTTVQDWQDSVSLEFVANGIPGVSVELVIPGGHEVQVGRTFPVITRIVAADSQTVSNNGPFRYSHTLEGVQPIPYPSGGSQALYVLQSPGPHVVRVVVHDSLGNAASAEAVVVGIVPWDLHMNPSGPLVAALGETVEVSLDLQPGYLAPPGSFWWEVIPEDPCASPFRIEDSQFSHQFDQAGRYVVTGHFMSDDGEVGLERASMIDVVGIQPIILTLLPYLGGVGDRALPRDGVMIEAVVQDALTENPVDARLTWTLNGAVYPTAQDSAFLIYHAGDAGSFADIVCTATTPTGYSSTANIQIPVNIPPRPGSIRISPDLSPLPAPATVTLIIEGSYDPDSNLPLTYQWFSWHDGHAGPLSPPIQTTSWTTDLPVGSHEIFVRVIDAHTSYVDSYRVMVEIFDP